MVKAVLADVNMRNREYAQAVAEGLVDALLRIETLYGTGRLYLP